jgi:hypothetical protein
MAAPWNTKDGFAIKEKQENVKGILQEYIK